MTQPTSKRRPAPARMLSLFLTAVVAVGAIVVLGFTSLSFWEGSCLTCHDVHAGAVTAQAHAGVECRQCHRDQDLAGIVSFRTRMLPMMKVFGAEAPGGLRPPVKSSRCVACHEGLLSEVTVSNGLRMSHAASFSAGQQCVDCHGAMFRRGAAAGAGAGISMDECLRCHVVSSLSNDCFMCHRGKVTLDAALRNGSFARTHDVDWEKRHGSGDLKSCSACHSIASCQSCHSVSLPHNEAWLGRHGAPALSDREGCRTCHSDEFCFGCHKLEMPHPRAFLALHSKEAEQTGVAACETCHDSKSCEQCHASHTHPGLTAERVLRLRREAGLNE